MKKLSFLAFIVMFALLTPTLFGVTTYEQTVTNQTSVTITNAQHGMNTTKYGVRVYNASGVVQYPSTYTAGIDEGNYSLTVSWPAAFSGKVKIIGTFPSLTSASTDFQVVRTTGNYGAYTAMLGCQYCTTQTPAVRQDANGKIWAAYNSGTVQLTATLASGSGTLRIFLQNGHTVYGFDAANAAAACSPQLFGEGSELRYGVTSWPADAIQLADVGWHWNAAATCTFYTPNDDRPASFK